MNEKITDWLDRTHCKLFGHKMRPKGLRIRMLVCTRCGHGEYITSNNEAEGNRSEAKGGS